MSMKNKQIDLSIVIPALNEELRIGKTLDELSVFLVEDKTMKTLNCEVLVVSADGRDNTHKVAKAHGKNIKNFQLLKPGKRVGKGRDVQYGMLRANGTYALFMDADVATPLRHIPIFYKEALAGYEVVVGTRNLKKHHSHLPRRALSMSGNMAFRILGGVWIEDSQCGFKLFTKEASHICFGHQTIMRWGFDMEVLTIAKTHKLKMKTLRINDWKNISGGTFVAGKIIENAIHTLNDLLRIALNRLMRKY